MRITREFIQKYLREFIERRTITRHDIISVCLCGSFLTDNYLIGDTGDIDLLIIHLDPPVEAREIIRITDDINLDIAHLCQADFRDTRQLRLDPWLGSSLNTCKILYDSQHYMDFVQASVRGQFDRPDYVFQRAHSLSSSARQQWRQLGGELSNQEPKPVSEPQAVQQYLKALGMAANTIAALSGPPIPLRRLLIDFLPRAENQNRPGFFHGLLGLLGASNITPSELPEWLNNWEETFDKITDNLRPDWLCSDRKNYYLGAFKEAMKNERPFTMIWPLMRTWTAMAIALPTSAPQYHYWHQAADRLGMTGESLNERINALDAFLDNIEEMLENWARQNGV